MAGIAQHELRRRANHRSPMQRRSTRHTAPATIRGARTSGIHPPGHAIRLSPWRCSLPQPFVARWMPPCPNPMATRLDSKRVIQAQGDHRGPPTDCQPQDVCAVLAPRKMAAPDLPAWVEQAHTTSRIWILAVYLGPFVLVAGPTGKPEIVSLVTAARNHRNDVIHFQRGVGERLLRQAIAAAIASLDAQPLTHHGRQMCGSHALPGERRPRRTASANASALRNCPASYTRAMSTTPAFRLLSARQPVDGRVIRSSSRFAGRTCGHYMNSIPAHQTATVSAPLASPRRPEQRREHRSAHSTPGAWRQQRVVWPSGTNRREEPE